MCIATHPGVEGEGDVPLNVFTGEQWTCDDWFRSWGTTRSLLGHVCEWGWATFRYEGEPPDALSEGRDKNAQKIASGPCEPGNKEYDIGSHYLRSRLVHPDRPGVHSLSQCHDYWYQRNVYAPVAGGRKLEHDHE